MQAKQHFDAGNLVAAIDALNQELKSQPNDVVRRTFLFELLCFAGDLDRAQKQLDVIAHQDAQTEWAAQVYGNLLAAERTRRRVFTDGLRPEFLLDAPPFVEWHLDALGRLRDGLPGEAVELLERSAQARPLLRGEVDGRPIDELRDCDDVLAPFLEVIVLRDYIWLPWDQVRELEISPPERPRDLLWATARVALADGSQRRCFLPTMYAPSYQCPDDRVKLGRMTDWRGPEGGPMQGLGMHMLLAGEDAMGLLDLRTLRLDEASSPPNTP